MADIFQEEIDSTENEKGRKKSCSASDDFLQMKKRSVVRYVPSDETTEFECGSGDDAENEGKSSVSNEIEIDFENFFLDELEELANSDYIHNRLYKEPQVTQIIRSNRLRWLGHVWRTSENNPTRLHTFKNPGGTRARGRPSTRWLDDTENGFKILKIKNWQRVALDCLSWKKHAVEAAKTCNRLLRS
ncbi:hypothetical protein AVEN_201465-1 [Araneus ventricosus]|uniref:Uncharacterized protein n=1 Tax=Araneus ventricosus TaxID=182803 RepID=A0A4Y2QD07_ARAVE|nr:hypothetical protein AVEN_29929-1 [Araneus ventricosus]GBN61526.1 hypothetical protein AVEN_201465-1 [Araneus ventricosus]